MTDEIHVTVASYGDGRNLMMVYFDPTTGKKVAKSSGTTDRKTAIGKAAVWEDELNSGRYQAPSRLTWAEFRKRYEAEKLATLAERTQNTAKSALNHIERVLESRPAGEVDADNYEPFSEQATQRRRRRLPADERHHDCQDVAARPGGVVLGRVDGDAGEGSEDARAPAGQGPNHDARPSDYRGGV